MSEPLNLIDALLAADVIEIDGIMVGRNFIVTEPQANESVSDWDDDIVRLQANYDDDDYRELEWDITGAELVHAAFEKDGWWTQRCARGRAFIRCYRLKPIRPCDDMIDEMIKNSPNKITRS